MKKVLVIYFSQTGQLASVISSVIEPLQKADDVELTIEQVRPKHAFPFPWSAMEFFEAFPESVQQVPCEMESFEFDEDSQYDLIILGYQPWFLSPSIPITSFLKSEKAAQVFRNTPVITIVGCRNMWLSAQEQVKRSVAELEGKLVGNIVLQDKAPNLVSVFTILRWLLWGKKGDSGIAEKEIKEANKFGEPITKSIQAGEFIALQDNLLELGAVEVHPNLATLEKRAHRIFSIWSKTIRGMGSKGSKRRSLALRLFGVYLLVGIFILSPVTTLLHYITLPFKRSKIAHQVAYYSTV